MSIAASRFEGKPTVTILDGLTARDCPVCDAPEHQAAPFLAATVDPARVGAFSFASRKQPEYMSFRLVRCRRCATIYAAEAPGAQALASAYEEAGYDSAEEAVYAAKTYAVALRPHLAPADLDGTALEIGTGTGVFLGELRRLGFAETIGVEPSAAAIAAAAPDVRAAIRSGVFTAETCEAESLSAVCCFMTLEHVPDPKALATTAFAMLRPGGAIALVTHDYTAPLNRALGKRSPIVDVEHMQLFCPAALRHLLAESGFESIEIERIRNTYPLRYWLRLVPLPTRLKAVCLTLADRVGLGRRPVALDVGNLLTVARKPAPASRPHAHPAAVAHRAETAMASS